MAARHGTRTKYNQGCHCDPCKKANNDYYKQRRQGQVAQTLAPVAQISAAPTAAAPKPSSEPSVREPGAVEAGVLAEIEDLPTFESRTGLVQVAIALARVLDTPLAIAQHSSSAHRLSETLDKLRRGADSRKGNLASVRRMTRPDTATG